MLSAVETSLEFRNMLLGSEIKTCTDHMNNVNPTTKHASKRLIHLRWLMEEFGPTFACLNRSDNNLADAISRIDTGHSVAHALCHLEVDDVIFKPEGDVAQAKMFNSLAEEEIPQHAFPLSTHVIATEKRKDVQLFKLMQTNPAYFTKKSRGLS